MDAGIVVVAVTLVFRVSIIVIIYIIRISFGRVSKVRSVIAIWLKFVNCLRWGVGLWFGKGI